MQATGQESGVRSSGVMGKRGDGEDGGDGARVLEVTEEGDFGSPQES